MKVRIISFTRRGRELSRKVRAAFSEMGMEEGEVLLYTGERGIEEGDCQALKGDLPTVVKASFHEKDPLIFIGASGICLRSIAPFINDKKADPPVLCLDEKGDFVIPLLSGHVGGANQLARRLAEHLGSQAVITTATDVNRRFAVDEWAEAKNLFWWDREAAKRISVDILKENEVGFLSDFPVSGSMPECLKFFEKFKIEQPSDMPKSGIVVSLSGKEKPFLFTLNVIPKIVMAGIGCRKNISEEVLQTKLQEALEIVGISKESLMGLASIDLKEKEEGLISLGKRWNLPVKFFSKEELLEAEGCFNHSPYVEKVTGVGNVCERAAILAAGGGSLLLEKRAGDGITVALAIKEWRVDFEYPNDWNRS